MRAPSLATALFFGLAACSGSDDPLQPDAGMMFDSGQMDAGMADLGLLDSGDLGVAEDAGMEEDAGAGDTGAFDAGFMADTGTVDMGVPDSGVRGDSGLPPDISCDENFFDLGGACGGPVAGTTWNYVNACGRPNELNDFLQFCEGSTVLSLDRTATGTLSFGLADQYLLLLDDALTAEVEIGAACEEDFGSCPQVEAFIRRVDPNATCSVMNETCFCSFTQILRVRNTGNYNAANNQIALLPMGGGLETWDYCVSNDGVLRYRPTPILANPMGNTFVLQ